jgi:GDPmannose 4,6-dehydratase
MSLEWTGEGPDERGIEPQSGLVRVAVDPSYFRPTEVDLLIGDASKAERDLGWSASTRLGELVRIMVRADYEDLSGDGAS